MDALKKMMKSELSSIIAPVVILLVVLTFQKGFLTSYNILSLLQTLAIYIVIGLSQMCALSLGQFNLSIGSAGALAAILMGYCYQNLGVNTFVGFLVGLLVGGLAGMLQGELIARTRMNPFIISLSLMSVYTGCATAICKGYAYSVPQGVIDFNRAKIANFFPVCLVLALFIMALIYIFIRYLRPGRELIATGENKRAAQFAGINYKRIIVMGHTLSGLLCGVAAFIQVARFGSAQSSVGDDWQMTSFAVAVLGGTLLSGGKVSVVGVMFGSILMVLLNNALVLWGFSTYTFQLILGIVLLGAYELDRIRQRVISRQSELNSEKAAEGMQEAQS